MLAVCKALMGKFEIVSIGLVGESQALAMKSSAHKGSLEDPNHFLDSK